MITVKNSQLDNETMSILNKILDTDINAGAAFKLMKIVKDLSPLIDDKVKLEKKIFEKWVERDEDGNPVQARDEKGNIVENAVKITDVGAFNAEMKDLVSIENELPHEKVKFSDLGLST